MVEFKQVYIAKCATKGCAQRRSSANEKDVKEWANDHKAATSVMGGRHYVTFGTKYNNGEAFNQ